MRASMYGAFARTRIGTRASTASSAACWPRTLAATRPEERTAYSEDTRRIPVANATSPKEFISSLNRLFISYLCNYAPAFSTSFNFPGQFRNKFGGVKHLPHDSERHGQSLSFDGPPVLCASKR